MSTINTSPLRPDDPNMVTNFYGAKLANSKPKKKMSAWIFGLAAAGAVVIGAGAIYLIFFF